MTLDDPTSSAYKKARRQHLKSLRARNQDVEQDWTPFRAAEKQYKARFPPPDLSGVLDLVTTESHGLGECGKGGWRGRSDTVAWSEVRLNLSEEDTRKGFTIPRVPGLVLLRAFVSPTMQRTLVRASLCDQARTPNETNLDTHYILPNDGLWNAHLHARKNPNETAAPIYPRRQYDATTAPDPPGPRMLIDNTPATPDNFTVLSTEPSPPAHPSPTAHPATCASLLPKLRWANIGYSYHWGSKQYDFSKGKGVVRDEYRELCREAVRAVRWEDVFGFVEDENGWSEDDWRTWTETYEPDAGIVNFYQMKDTLMGHVDRSEVCATSPLVSISLGNAAIFLIGGLTRDVEPVPILLRSGDVVIMSGPACRRAYHGVPRVLENTLPAHFESHNSQDEDWAYYEEYLRNTRININVRQVFPKGFEPDSAAGAVLQHQSTDHNADLGGGVPMRPS